MAAATASVVDPAAVCKAAGVTYLRCFPPMRDLGHPGLCLFSAPLTRGSSLGVKLDALSVPAIKQRLIDWARDNNIAYVPLEEDDVNFETRTRG